MAAAILSETAQIVRDVNNKCGVVFVAERTFCSI
jgi:hypothetical protein